MDHPMDPSTADGWFGAAIAVGIDHDAYRHAVDPLPASVRDSLALDLA